MTLPLIGKPIVYKKEPYVLTGYDQPTGNVSVTPENGELADVLRRVILYDVPLLYTAGTDKYAIYHPNLPKLTHE